MGDNSKEIPNHNPIGVQKATLQEPTDKDAPKSESKSSTPLSNFDKTYIPTDKDKGIYIDKENKEPPVEFKMKTIEQREELNKQTDESVKEGFERVEEKSDEVEEKSDQVVEYDLNKDLKDDSIYTEEGKISAISGLEEVKDALKKEDDFELESIEEMAEKIENAAGDVREVVEEAKKTGKVEDDEKVAERIDDTIEIIIEPREELVDKLLEGDNGAVSVALVEIEEKYKEIMEKNDRRI